MEKLKQLLDAGCSIKEAAHHLGINYFKCHRIIQQYGYEVKNNKPNEKEVMQMFSAGKSISDIAHELGYHYNTIYYIVHKHTKNQPVKKQKFFDVDAYAKDTVTI